MEKTDLLSAFVEQDPEGRRFDPVEVADKVERLADDPTLRCRIAKINASLARLRFAPAVVALRLARIYQGSGGPPAVPPKKIITANDNSEEEPLDSSPVPSSAPWLSQVRST